MRNPPGSVVISPVSGDHACQMFSRGVTVTLYVPHRSTFSPVGKQMLLVSNVRILTSSVHGLGQTAGMFPNIATARVLVALQEGVPGWQSGWTFSFWQTGLLFASHMAIVGALQKRSSSGRRVSSQAKPNASSVVKRR